MGKKLAIYIKQFENIDEQKYIYGEELDTYISRLTDTSEWESVKIYKDKIEKDIDSTTLKAYHRMIKKALKKEIDVIATFSISLFGKNRDEALEYINKLIKSDVELHFFNEEIKVPSIDGNAYIKLLNKLSTDESIKYSVQTKKQVKKSFQKGKAHTPTTYFLGYDTDKNGVIVINEEEARIVRRIFNDFMLGKGTPAIAKELTNEKVKTARGNTNWTSNAVYKMIKQEKYYGAVRTQKSVTLEPRTHKRVLNRENETQYLIKNNHPGIISEDMFFKVQRELKIRSEKRKKGKDGIISTYSNTSVYSNIFVCGDCGRPVIRRTLTSKRNGEKVYFKAWQCRVAAGREKDLKCRAQYVWEEELNKSVKEVFIKLKESKGSIFSEIDGNHKHPVFTNEENKLLEELTKQIEAIDTRLNEISNLTILGKDIAYEESLDKLTAKREQINNKYEILKSNKYESELSEKQLDVLLDVLEQFDPEKSNIGEIFSKIVQKGTLFNNHRLEIQFKCGIVRKFIAEKSR
jgi:DNA invertase Pin-like site-specific DNA recombinase